MSNPSIRDTVRRVAFDGSSRHTGFVLPVLRDALAAEGAVDGLALTEALWARMWAGLREDGSTIAPNDPSWQSLHEAAREPRTQPLAWLRQGQIHGELAEDPRFANVSEQWLSRIWASGTRAAPRAYARPQAGTVGIRMRDLRTGAAPCLPADALKRWLGFPE